MRETDLYPPVKAFLEAQGYAVKGEITGCDIVAIPASADAAGPSDPVIVELKLTFSLDLLFQGVERQRITDWVYVAIPAFGPRASRKRQQRIVGLCRRLGLGLLVVRDGVVEPWLDPAPYAPRKLKPRRTRLLREFALREGDTTAGGHARGKIMTAYRQAALHLATTLADGPAKASDLARDLGIPKAREILYRNVYGWFDRQGRGVYALSPAGRKALAASTDTSASSG
ncbi:MAG: DUF2161 family putative PD-(D/E)XK-type phosphodiesterase [Pseudomonadota bacterium]